MTTEIDIGMQVKASLDSLVSGRVYELFFPQKPNRPVWPAIRYTFISVVPTQDICGDGGEETADYRLQIDVVVDLEKGPSEFKDVCKQVKDAMAELQPVYVWVDQSDSIDEETRTWRRTIDYMIYLSSPD